MIQNRKRYRITSGESYNVGRVFYTGSSTFDFKLSNGAILADLDYKDWDYELLPEPVNPVNGMIIVFTESEGKPSAIYRKSAWYWINTNNSQNKLADDVDKYGYFEVVYDPTPKETNQNSD